MTQARQPSPDSPAPEGWLSQTSPAAASLELLPPQLIHAVREDYPSSIAVPFAELVSELSLVKRNPAKIFSRMLDLFEISVATAGLATVCDLLAHRVPLTGHHGRMIRELRENTKLSTGFWWELLRHGLGAALENNESGFSRELASLYFIRKGNLSEEIALLDAIPEVRNKAKGHSWTMPDEKYEEYIRAYLPVLAQWLGMLSLFRSWVIVSPQAVSPVKGVPVWDCWSLAGNRAKPDLRRLRTEKALAIGSTYLIQVNALQAESTAETVILPLSPLFLVRKTNGMFHEIFLYQGGDGKKAIYSGTCSAERHESLEEAAPAFEFLSHGKQSSSGLSLKVERLLAHAREACAKATEKFLHSVIDRHIYDPETFARRPRVREQITGFLQSELPCALLHATSGMGKTSLAANLGAEWLETPGNTPMLALVAAENLPADGRDLPRYLADLLQGELDLGAVVRRVAAAMPRKKACVCLIIIDGIDRHPNPQWLLEGITAAARIFQEGAAFKILGTCTSSIPETFLQSGGRFEESIFYRSSFGLSESMATAAPGIELAAMSQEELAEAFATYQRIPERATSTPFEALNEEMINTLSNPLILRMAMAVYQGQPLPRKVFGVEMVKEYLAERVFKFPARLDVVTELVDLMVAGHRRSIPFEALRNHPRMRATVVDESAAGPLRQLCDDQVFTLRPVPAPHNLPFPFTWTLEFTFDRVLEYLVFWRLVDRQPEHLTQLDSVIELARQFTAARGAAILLCTHLAFEYQIEPLSALFAKSDDAWLHDFWADLVGELLETSEGAEEAPAFDHLLRALAADNASLLLRTVSTCAEQFFLNGKWGQAFRLLAVASRLDHIEETEVARLLNRCVLLQKNMDQWTDALETSDRCLQLADTEVGPELMARLLINRSSVIFDLGPRAEVPSILFEAHACAGTDTFLNAAIGNNAGLYHLYNDELETAEALLRKGLLLTDEQSLQQAYLQTNLSLTLLSRTLLEPMALEEAERIAIEALGIFRQKGHLQGVSYATSLQGVFQMLHEHWPAAEASFRETRRIAQRLGEKWTDYGAKANLACLLLSKPGGNIDEAWTLAQEAVASSRENSDRKGIGDAGLIAACAGLRLLRLQPEDLLLRSEIEATLLAAEEGFQALNQRLGQAMAQWGLEELSGLGKQDGPPGHTLQPLLEATSYRHLQPGLRPLPWHMMFLMEVF